MADYGPREHRFNFAAWTAARASSRGLAGFNLSSARDALVSVGLKELAAGVGKLPEGAKSFDKKHIEWCDKIIGNVQLGQELTYGRAAKLVNVYLKTLFLSEFGKEPTTDPNDDSIAERTNAIHPPIDRLLLDALAKTTKPRSKFWAEKRDRGWTEFCQEEYQEVISYVRALTNGEMWRIESHWNGSQAK